MGTEAEHKGTECHSWFRIGAVWRVGATIADADRLEAKVKQNLIDSGTKLAKGKPAPALQALREPNFLVDDADSVATPRFPAFNRFASSLLRSSESSRPSESSKATSVPVTTLPNSVHVSNPVFEHEELPQETL